jgi:hypothetical protein
MVTMKNAAIFGCGGAGRRAYLHFRSKYRIVAFLDNDARKHGSSVLGVPVHDPDVYDYSEVEHVFIGSMYFDEILVQLLAFAVPSSKIEFVSSEILMRDALETTAGGLLFPQAIHALRRAFYMPFRLLR